MARTKAQILQVRLTDQLKFTIDLIAKQDQRKLVQVVEAAIERRVAELDLGLPFDRIWDEDEGVRTLRLLALPAYRADENERAIRTFVNHHRVFFYSASGEPHRDYVMVLWPRLRHYVDVWRAKRHENHWCAAEEMADVLKARKIKPPKYG